MLAKAFIRNDSGEWRSSHEKEMEQNSDLPLAHKLAWRANNFLDYQGRSKENEIACSGQSC